MNQALLAALQTTINEKNIILLAPYGCPEDDIIAACNEIIEAAKASKEARLEREAELAKQAEAPVNPEVVS